MKGDKVFSMSYVCLLKTTDLDALKLVTVV